MTLNHIFISYKREQCAYALIVRDKLQHWGYEVWLDVDRLQPGTYWANDIDHALKTCRACLGIMTPQALASRNVTNEWDMAIMKGKFFIPLMFDFTEPHYKYIDIQYIDFTSKDKRESFDQLKVRLDTSKSESNTKPHTDLYHNYLQKLYARINDYLAAKLITSLQNDEGQPEPIRLSAQHTEDAVDSRFSKSETIDPLFVAGGITDQPLQEFDDFTKAFEYYDGRVLLLGEPGSGKTVTLLHFARDAIVKRRLNASAPLPILVIIPAWNTNIFTDFIDWLPDAYGIPPEVRTILQSGDALLLLDGLDELGKERLIDSNNPTGGKYDPRLRFIQHLPANNQIILTCRAQDYEEVAEKVPLRGAITLKPLTDTQIQVYLKEQPELFEFVQSEPRIKEWLHTPLLLSFFAFAYQGMTGEERKQFINLRTKNEFRDKVFDDYLRQRVEHEANKYEVSGVNFPFSFDEIQQALGRAATEALGGWKVFRQFSKDGEIDDNDLIVHSDFREALEEDKIEQFIHLSQKLQLIVDTGSFVTNRSLYFHREKAYRFTHLLLRDYFAFRFSMAFLMANPNAQGSHAATSALGELRDPRALKALARTLKSKYQAVKLAAIHALVRINHPKSPEHIKRALKDKDPTVRSRAIEVLFSEFLDAVNHDLFTSMLDDKEESVQETAIYVVGELQIVMAAPKLIELLGHKYSRVYEASQSALVKMGEKAVSLLLNALNSSIPDVREGAALILGAMENAECLPDLANLLKDSDIQVRYSAAKALTWLRRPSLPLRIAILSNVEDDNWIEIASCQNILCEDEIIPLMVNALSASNERVVATAAEFFQRVYDESVRERLLQLLKAESRWVRIEAVRALEYHKDERVTDGLMSLLKEPISHVAAWVDGFLKVDDYGVKDVVIQVLGKWGDNRAAKAIIDELDSDNESLVSSAVDALGAIRSKKATRPLIQLLRTTASEHLQRKIIEALGNIQDTRAVEPMIGVLIKQISDRGIAEALVNSLELIGTDEAILAIEKWRKSLIEDS